MIIFKGKRLKPELHDNLPPGTLVEKSSKGYMTNELFKEFLKHLARYKSPGRCLLVFDSAACHLNLSIVDVGDSLDIDLYCLPSNTTHELQPLDKSVYRSFEHHWDNEVLLFLDQNPNKKLTKSHFNIILSNVWSKCMTHSNIINGFKAGLFPLNPEAIPETAFAPSILSDVLAPDDTHKENRRPPESPQPGPPGMASNKSGKFSYSNVYSSDSDSTDDHIPLAELKRRTTKVTSFNELLPTPIKTNEKPKKNRKKALNYKGTPVTRDLFTEENKSRAKLNKDIESSREKLSTEWYYHGCEEDRQADMRQCSKCLKWYHEVGIGLTDNDMDDFKCPDGC
ncbi:uncharacterized protein LOC126739540 [Anthonomus grandis grandis]|uniref:uncharacterized protein LOC126739540 n=1 Tax=Anthonomus grandis grandis TaxID=2921223 RepID=UPI00216586E5|nr:uncharacterized protein LOC126739540 [Anthonomus grandis grandis]